MEGASPTLSGKGVIDIRLNACASARIDGGFMFRKFTGAQRSYTTELLEIFDMAEEADDITSLLSELHPPKAISRNLIWRGFKCLLRTLVLDIVNSNADSFFAKNALLAAVALYQIPPNAFKELTNQNVEEPDPTRAQIIFDFIRLITSVLVVSQGSFQIDSNVPEIALRLYSVSNVTGPALEDHIFPGDKTFFAGRIDRPGKGSVKGKRVWIHPMVLVLKELREAYDGNKDQRQNLITSSIRRNDARCPELQSLCVAVHVLNLPMAQENTTVLPYKAENRFYRDTLRVLLDILYYSPEQLLYWIRQWQNQAVTDDDIAVADLADRLIYDFYLTAVEIWLDPLVTIVTATERNSFLENESRNTRVRSRGCVERTFREGVIYNPVLLDINKGTGPSSQNHRECDGLPLAIGDILPILGVLREILPCKPNNSRKVFTLNIDLDLSKRRSSDFSKYWGDDFKRSDHEVFPKTMIRRHDKIPYFIQFNLDLTTQEMMIGMAKGEGERSLRNRFHADGNPFAVHPPVESRDLFPPLTDAEKEAQMDLYKRNVANKANLEGIKTMMDEEFRQEAVRYGRLITTQSDVPPPSYWSSLRSTTVPPSVGAGSSPFMLLGEDDNETLNPGTTNATRGDLPAMTDASMECPDMELSNTVSSDIIPTPVELTGNTSENLEQHVDQPSSDKLSGKNDSANCTTLSSTASTASATGNDQSTSAAIVAEETCETVMQKLAIPSEHEKKEIQQQCQLELDEIVGELERFKDKRPGTHDYLFQQGERSACTSFLLSLLTDICDPRAFNAPILNTECPEDLWFPKHEFHGDQKQIFPGDIASVLEILEISKYFLGQVIMLGEEKQNWEFLIKGAIAYVHVLLEKGLRDNDTSLGPSLIVPLWVKNRCAIVIRLLTLPEIDDHYSNFVPTPFQNIWDSTDSRMFHSIYRISGFFHETQEMQSHLVIEWRKNKEKESSTSRSEQIKAEKLAALIIATNKGIAKRRLSLESVSVQTLGIPTGAVLVVDLGEEAKDKMTADKNEGKSTISDKNEEGTIESAMSVNSNSPNSSTESVIESVIDPPSEAERRLFASTLQDRVRAHLAFKEIWLKMNFYLGCSNYGKLLAIDRVEVFDIEKRERLSLQEFAKEHPSRDQTRFREVEEARTRTLISMAEESRAEQLVKFKENNEYTEENMIHMLEETSLNAFDSEEVEIFFNLSLAKNPEFQSQKGAYKALILEQSHELLKVCLENMTNFVITENTKLNTATEKQARMTIELATKVREIIGHVGRLTQKAKGEASDMGNFIGSLMENLKLVEKTMEEFNHEAGARCPRVELNEPQDHHRRLQGMGFFDFHPYSRVSNRLKFDELIKVLPGRDTSRYSDLESTINIVMWRRTHPKNFSPKELDAFKEFKDKFDPENLKQMVHKYFNAFPGEYRSFGSFKNLRIETHCFALMNYCNREMGHIDRMDITRTNEQVQISGRSTDEQLRMDAAFAELGPTLGITVGRKLHNDRRQHEENHPRKESRRDHEEDQRKWSRQQWFESAQFKHEQSQYRQYPDRTNEYRNKYPDEFPEERYYHEDRSKRNHQRNSYYLSEPDGRWIYDRQRDQHTRSIKSLGPIPPNCISIPDLSILLRQVLSWTKLSQITSEECLYLAAYFLCHRAFKGLPMSEPFTHEDVFHIKEPTFWKENFNDKYIGSTECVQTLSSSWLLFINWWSYNSKPYSFNEFKYITFDWMFNNRIYLDNTNILSIASSVDGEVYPGGIDILGMPKGINMYRYNTFEYELVCLVAKEGTKQYVGGTDLGEEALWVKMKDQTNIISRTEKFLTEIEEIRKENELYESSNTQSLISESEITEKQEAVTSTNNTQEPVVATIVRMESAESKDILMQLPRFSDVLVGQTSNIDQNMSMLQQQADERKETIQVQREALAFQQKTLETLTSIMQNNSTRTIARSSTGDDSDAEDNDSAFNARHSDQTLRGKNPDKEQNDEENKFLSVILAENTFIHAGKREEKFPFWLVFSKDEFTRRIPPQVLDELKITLDPEFGPWGINILKVTTKGPSNPCIFAAFNKTRHTFDIQSGTYMGSFSCSSESLQAYLATQEAKTKILPQYPEKPNAAHEEVFDDARGFHEPFEPEKGANKVYTNTYPYHDKEFGYKEKDPPKDQLPNEKTRSMIKKLAMEPGMMYTSDPKKNMGISYMLLHWANTIVAALGTDASILDHWKWAIPHLLASFIDKDILDVVALDMQKIVLLPFANVSKPLWDVRRPPSVEDREVLYPPNSAQFAMVKTFNNCYAFDGEALVKSMETNPNGKIQGKQDLDSWLMRIRRLDSWLPPHLKLPANGRSSMQSILVANLSSKVLDLLQMQFLTGRTEVAPTGVINPHLMIPFTALIDKLDRIFLIMIVKEPAPPGHAEEDSSEKTKSSKETKDTVATRTAAAIKGNVFLGSASESQAAASANTLAAPIMDQQELEKVLQPIRAMIEGMKRNVETLLDTTLTPRELTGVIKQPLPGGAVQSHFEIQQRSDGPNGRLTPTLQDQRRNVIPDKSFAAGQSQVSQSGSAPRSPPTSSNGSSGGGYKRTSPRLNATQQDPGLCYQFLDSGVCKFGDKCKYLHKQPPHGSAGTELKAKILSLSAKFNLPDLHELQEHVMDLQYLNSPEMSADEGNSTDN